MSIGLSGLEALVDVASKNYQEMQDTVLNKMANTALIQK